MNAACYIALTTFPETELAQRFAQAAIGDKLAACAQILPPMQSIYQWQGQIEQAEEVQVQLKTTQAKLRDLQQLLERMHPYDVPEFIALPVARGANRYLSWLNASLS